MANTELILSLGMEGGGVSVHRTTLALGGDRFHVEGSSLCLDANDDEVWKYWNTEPVETLEEALRMIDQSGFWVLFHPISVHPQFRIAVWRCVQEIALTVPDDWVDVWQARSHEWWRHCHPDS